MPPDQFDSEPAPGAVPPDGPAFSLHSDPPPARAAGLTRSTLARYAALYGTGARQLRRWWKAGAPLDDPRAMPAWWERNHKWDVPERILQAAAAAQNPEPTPSPAPPVVESGQTSATAPPPESTPSASAATAPTSPAVATGSPPPLPAGAPGPVAPGTVRPINIEDFDPDEGDRFAQLKKLQAARFDELHKALAAGQDASHLETKYLKLSDTIDKMETRIADRLKKRGALVLKAAVARDLATAAELIRQMGESQIRRILERCPALTAPDRQAVADALRADASAHARVFRNLSSLKAVTASDVDQLLAA